MSLQEALRVGQALRATSATAVHGRSSRSHLVMTLLLTMRDAATSVVRHTGKLSFVDLAGSERLKSSKAVGERRREAQHINRSLSALADVISAKERRVSHVPYRNSKLTQLLQDALGGQQQCRTVVIVALPPTRCSLSDTLHSLQFSARLSALTLPFVFSRRSLRSPSLPSVPDNGGEDRSHLKLEVNRWRSEYERAQAELHDCKQMLDAKERQLGEAARRNAELVANTRSFERNQAQLLHGFVALNQRLQAVEAVTIAEEAEGVEGQDPQAVAVEPSGLAAARRENSWSPPEAFSPLLQPQQPSPQQQQQQQLCLFLLVSGSVLLSLSQLLPASGPFVFQSSIRCMFWLCVLL